MENPFTYGRIVTNDDFVGRDEELGRLHNIIKLGESAIIHSPIGMGKSSLLAELARRNRKNFDFVYVNLTGVADVTSLLETITLETMGAIYGSIEDFPGQAWELLSNPKLKRVTIERAMSGDRRPHGATKLPLSTANPITPEEAGPAENRRIRMCPQCGRPLKWMENYSRYYCYNCRKYMPIQRTSRLSGTTMRPPDELSCPRCNGLLKFVYTYSEHYCENCRRYPMLEARRKTKEKPTFADLIEALDLPERLANQTLTRVVMMLDDFHELASIQNPVVLEAIGQRCEMHGNVSYIFTGGNLPVMNRFFRERHSPLHDIAEWIDLGPLQDAALERFLIDKFRLAKGRLSKEAADFIIGASGGYPSYVQMIAHEVYHIAESPSMNSVEDGIQAVVMHRSAVYSLLWDSIRSPLHKRYLLAAANEPRVPRGEDFVQRHGLKSRSHVQRTEKQLEAKGVVKKGEIIDPMFVLWLRSHAS